MKKLIAFMTVALSLLSGAIPAFAMSSGEEQTSWTQSALEAGE